MWQRLPEPSPEELDRLRALYEERRDLTVAQAAAEAGIPYSRLKDYAARYRWRRRKSVQHLPAHGAQRHRGYYCPGLAACPERSALVARLWAGAEGQIAEAEARLAAHGLDTVPDREARTLAVLVRTLERLAALDIARPPPRDEADAAARPRTVDELCDALERRLAELEGPRLDGRGPRRPDA